MVTIDDPTGRAFGVADGSLHEQRALSVALRATARRFDARNRRQRGFF